MEAKQMPEMRPGMVGPVGPHGKMDERFDAFCRKMLPDQAEKAKDMPGRDARRPSTLGTSLQAYSEKHSSKLDKVKQLLASDNWNFKKSEQGVDISTLTLSGERFCHYKATTTVKAHGRGIQHIFMGLLQVQDRPEWDGMCMTGEMLECFLPYYRVSYYQMKSPIPGLVADRDFVVCVRPFFEEDGSITAVAQSIKTEQKPEKAPFIRLNVLLNAYIINPTEDPDVFKLTVVGSVDPCGWLPTFLKNLIMWKQGLSLAKLRPYLEKH